MINLFSAAFKTRVSFARVMTISLLLVVFFFPFAQKSFAAGSLTVVKDTLSNSRPSVATTLGAQATAGDTTITLATTRGILQGDSLTLVQGTPETATVAAVLSNTQVSLTTALANTHTNGSAVYNKQTSIHTITFTTRSTVASGSFDVIFSGATTNAGVPTSQFDFNSTTTTDVSVTGFTAGTKTLTAGSGTWNIAFSSSISSSTAITITIGSTNKMLNPTKSAADGTADTWTVQVVQKDGSSNTVDTTSVKVATIESVTVTATIAPTLTFTIAGVAGSTSVAGQTTSAASTATTVPFGTITAGTPAYVAQILSVSTNADTGYTVTGYQDGALRKSNGTTITSFSTTPAEQNGNNGFGFSLASASGTTASFLYNDSSNTLRASGFGTSTSPSTIMSNTAAANSDSIRVLYIVRVGSTQATGDYRNVVTYIATASY